MFTAIKMTIKFQKLHQLKIDSSESYCTALVGLYFKN